jgi:hypothetical protein
MTITTPLPPPYTFEKKHSSYQVEWEEHYKASLSPDVDVLDLLWHVCRKETNKTNVDQYLLACTSVGEVIIWKVEQNALTDGIQEGLLSTNRMKAGVIVGEYPLKRLRVSSGPVHKLRIFVNEHSKENADTIVERDNPKKRKQSLTDASIQEESQTSLYVAGSDGLWSMSIDEILSPAGYKDDVPDKVKKLSDEDTLDIQIYQHFLYALQSNKLLQMDLLSVDGRLLSISMSPHLLPRDHRIHGQKEETCTSMLVTKVGSGNEFEEGISTILVGTNRSRVLLLRMGRDDSSSTSLRLLREPQILYVSAAQANPVETAITVNTSRSLHVGGTSSVLTLSRNVSSSSHWSFLQIIEIQGTWWTAIAKRECYWSQDCIHDNIRGLLVTWHAPSMTIAASVETQEALNSVAVMIQSTCDGNETNYVDPKSTGSSSMLCTGTNTKAVTIWKAPYQLERTGRFWISSHSSYAVAPMSLCFMDVDDEDHRKRAVVAVGGVGNQIDLFVEHCRVQVITICE